MANGRTSVMTSSLEQVFMELQEDDYSLLFKSTIILLTFSLNDLRKGTRIAGI